MPQLMLPQRSKRLSQLRLPQQLNQLSQMILLQQLKLILILTKRNVCYVGVKIHLVDQKLSNGSIVMFAIVGPTVFVSNSLAGLILGETVGCVHHIRINNYFASTMFIIFFM